MISRDQTIASVKKIGRRDSQQGTSLTRQVDYLIFNKKLGELNAEDLRLLIGQNESLEICIPIAIELLRANPMIEGDYFPGDLLKNVLSTATVFWQENQPLKEEVRRIVVSNRSVIFGSDISDDIKEQLSEAIEKFMN